MKLEGIERVFRSSWVDTGTDGKEADKHVDRPDDGNGEKRAATEPSSRPVADIAWVVRTYRYCQSFTYSPCGDEAGADQRL